jgi:hypothetical protein
MWPDRVYVRVAKSVSRTERRPHTLREESTQPNHTNGCVGWSSQQGRPLSVQEDPRGDAWHESTFRFGQE